MTGVDTSPISGFPEWLPDKRLVEQRMLDTIRRSYELFGFTSIETPAVERLGVLTSKGGIQRQIFSVGKPAAEDAAGPDLALRFDLTVPLARYVASRNHDLTFPFRRYQIQKVWRGERAQRGRFREFYQCDIDIIGREALDLLYDAEIARVIGSVFEALGVRDFALHISNRKILSALTEAFGLDDPATDEVLRLIDKSASEGAEAAGEALLAAGIAAPVAAAVRELLGAGDLAEAQRALVAIGARTDGVDELQQVFDAALELGMSEAHLKIDLGIARGLDYYTGTVYETFVGGHADWGSVCSGGRYDNLAGTFTNRRLPGVGISVGATRLLELLTQSGVLKVGVKTPTQVLVSVQDRGRHLAGYLRFAAQLRDASIPCEVYLQPRKLGDQLRYASDLGIPLVLIAGDDEFSRSTVQVRTMRTAQQAEVPAADLVSAVAASLAS